MQWFIRFPFSSNSFMTSAFERIARGENGHLVEAALEVATDVYPDLNVGLYLEQMQVLSEAFDIFIGAADTPKQLLQRLNAFFFDELGFRGNEQDYYDPRNSYLNEVLDRRLGIPITLAVIYRYLATNSGIHLDAISFPGHFLLAYTNPSGHRLYIDVFHQGSWLEWSDCVEMAQQKLGVPKLDEDEMVPASDRDILARMLRNLKAIYSPNDLHRCLAVQERLVRLLPKSAAELRDLCVMYYHLDKPMLAMKTLQTLVRHSPEYAMQKGVRQYLSEATKEAVRLN